MLPYPGFGGPLDGAEVLPTPTSHTHGPLPSNGQYLRETLSQKGEHRRAGSPRMAPPRPFESELSHSHSGARFRLTAQGK
jgi:hypothetical protein